MGTKIEWTDETWNPVTGCQKVSPGCLNCYAERMADRLRAIGSPKYQDPFDAVTFHMDVLTRPDHWIRPRMIFVCSMGDLFHPDVPFSVVSDVLAVAHRNPHHTFQVLTKRAERLEEFGRTVRFPGNVWVGVSVESDPYVSRVRSLRHLLAPVRFVSLEPLLDGVPSLLPLPEYLDWVIVGGETGPGARPIPGEWVRRIRGACELAGVPFFFKQWGDRHSPRGDREIDGRLWEQMPQGAGDEMDRD